MRGSHRQRKHTLPSTAGGQNVILSCNGHRYLVAGRTNTCYSTGELTNTVLCERRLTEGHVSWLPLEEPSRTSKSAGRESRFVSWEVLGVKGAGRGVARDRLMNADFFSG